MHVKQIYSDMLKKYSDDIEELLDLLRRMKAPADKGDIARARELFKALKQRLDSDCKEGRTEKSRSQLSEIDLRYYRPAVEGAHSHLRLKAGSAPGPRWIDGLTAAWEEINQYLDLLEKGY